MGVDYYSCDHCAEIFDDCGGRYDHCEKCGKMICHWCQVELDMRTAPKHFSEDAKPLGDFWKEETYKDHNGGEHTYYTLIRCPYCTNEVISDDRVLSYLLTKYDLKKEKVIQEIKRKELSRYEFNTT